MGWTGKDNMTELDDMNNNGSHKRWENIAFHDPQHPQGYEM